MARRPKHLYIEEKLLFSIESIIENLNEQNYQVSESDIINEALSYGIPLVRIRREVGNDKFHQIFTKLTKEGVNNDK